MTRFPAALILGFLIIPGMVSRAQVSQFALAPGDLIWSDEFDGTGVPDPAKWERLEYNRRNNDNGPDGWWSNEDSYLDGNGNLVIRVRRIEDRNGDGDSCDFSTGMIRSKGKFEQRYGRFEVRCKLPTQPGWWVAFWMMQGKVSSTANGGVDGTEVDIMEGFGWTDRVQHALHWDGYGDAHQSVHRSWYKPGMRNGYHVYALEWYPEKYVFYIDGQETWRTEGGGVCDQPGYVKVTGELSTLPWALGTNWAWDVARAEYPDSFLVDYVRVYEIGEYEPAVSISAPDSGGRIDVVPNPATGHAVIRWNEEAFPARPSLSLFSAEGKALQRQAEIFNGWKLELGHLPPGLYLLTLVSDGDREVLKLFKRPGG